MELNLGPFTSRINGLPVIMLAMAPAPNEVSRSITTSNLCFLIILAAKRPQSTASTVER